MELKQKHNHQDLVTLSPDKCYVSLLTYEASIWKKKKYKCNTIEEFSLNEVAYIYIVQYS